MGDGILAGPLDAEPEGPKVYPPVTCVPGLVVKHRSGVTGAVIDWRPSRVTLLDRGGRRHEFINERGHFFVNGRPITLVAAERPPSVRSLTNSGSIAPKTPSRARVARASRIWVEGIHDAELVECVWGDDLRSEGIVVEPIGGIDDLAGLVARFDPGPERRLGILVDHLVPGSKEQRIAQSVQHRHVLITGHVFVDVWAAISPALVGLRVWPEIPRDTQWKDGICAALGVADQRDFWRALLGKVDSYKDLHPTLVGSVEQLVDFVTEAG